MSLEGNLNSHQQHSWKLTWLRWDLRTLFLKTFKSGFLKLMNCLHMWQNVYRMCMCNGMLLVVGVSLHHVAIVCEQVCVKPEGYSCVFLITFLLFLHVGWYQWTSSSPRGCVHAEECKVNSTILNLLFPQCLGPRFLRNLFAITKDCFAWVENL